MKDSKKSVVLVVDDDGQVREILIQYLKSFGFENVLQAKNGRAALKIIQNPQQIIDIVISDWEMPQIDGLTLLRAVRKDPVRKNLKFLMVSSQGSHERMKITKAAKSHVDAYLVKPFRVNDLKAKMEKLAAGESDESSKAFDAVFAQTENVTTLVYDLSKMQVSGIVELISAHQKVGEVDKAISLGLEALKLHTHEPEIHLALGMAFFLKSDYENAKAHLSRVPTTHLKHEEAQAFLHEINSQNVA